MKIVQSDETKLVIRWGKVGHILAGVVLLLVGAGFLSRATLLTILIGAALVIGGVLFFLLSNTIRAVFDKSAQTATVEAKSLLGRKQRQYQFSQINQA